MSAAPERRSWFIRNWPALFLGWLALGCLQLILTEPRASTAADNLRVVFSAVLAMMTVLAVVTAALLRMRASRPESVAWLRIRDREGAPGILSLTMLAAAFAMAPSVYGVLLQLLTGERALALIFSGSSVVTLIALAVSASRFGAAD